MKKGYYLFPTYVKSDGALIFSGVMNKMNMQVDELSKHFDIEFKIVYATDDWSAVEHKILNRIFPWYSLRRKYDEIINEMADPDFVYIRKVEADKEYIAFLKHMRKRFPKTKLIVEIPTYPYERDAYKKITSKICLIKDRHYRKKYKDYINRFVTFTNDDTIFGVKTIKTMNGICVENQKLIKTREKDNNLIVNILFVGMMQRQHGLERIIRGLKEYYKEHRIIAVKLHLIGDGPEYENYRMLASQCGIDEYIIFYGKKMGDDLNELYDLADVAIAPLGCYKTLEPSTRSSALKTREYLARGLPIITGCIEDVFEQYECDFHIDFDNNDSDIDINLVVDWYKKLIQKYGSREQLALKIRNYALEYVDNSSTMKPIIRYIKEE